MSQTQYRRHMEKISRPFACPQEACTFRAASNRDLKRHLASNLHPESTGEIFLCPVVGCKYANRGFSRRDHFRRHIRTRHPGVETASAGGTGSSNSHGSVVESPSP